MDQEAFFKTDAGVFIAISHVCCMVSSTSPLTAFMHPYK